MEEAYSAHKGCKLIFMLHLYLLISIVWTEWMYPCSDPAGKKGGKNFVPPKIWFIMKYCFFIFWNRIRLWNIVVADKDSFPEGLFILP